MNSYISREAAFQLCSDAQGKAGTKAELTGISKIWAGLKRLPAADVAPVVHAKWKAMKGEWPECSRCGHRPEWVYGQNRVQKYNFTAYCPSCGAKMEGE